MTRSEETDVLIVGGGPVGLALSLDLTHRGVRHIVIDAGDGVVRHPKVSTVGPRSMEHFRRWGVAGRVRDAGWPPGHPLDIAWVTRVGEYEIHRFERGTAAARPVFRHTPEPDQVCPAHLLNPVLAGAVGRPLRYLHRLEHFEQDAGCVRATISSNGEESVVWARYLVACDGSSSVVRKALGIDSPARHEAQVFRNVLFRAPGLPARLAERGHRSALVYYLMHSWSLRYPMRSLDGRGLYNMVVDGRSDQGALELIRSAIAFDVPVELVADGLWHLTHRVADRYRAGRVFLAGDAAHTLSPSGGFGMNTGIGDAADLGWKLAAAVAGWAGDGLLGTYETERRPVAIAGLDAAEANLRRTVDRDLPAELAASTEKGARLRAEMAERLVNSGAREEFDAPRVHFGFHYRSPIVVSDGPAEQGPRWRPGSDPGCRAAHAWVRPGVSTLDLFGDGFTLLRFADSPALSAFVTAFTERGVPFRSVLVGDPDTAALYGHRFVLVRPDGHVAWRGDDLEAAPANLADLVRGAG
ncbi:FAD-dependent monooxygenase [Nonomuraea longicatena]|uniref:FAD-dependent oxidoreductase n=1 Tax=Nonomuraea longicatena TaxID=83682 RepID=Q27IF2_9ACTN|nr:InkE [Nonomuraea longicatena]ACN29721.1 monooxygenase [Nonomuraea longicatena]